MAPRVSCSTSSSPYGPSLLILLLPLFPRASALRARTSARTSRCSRPHRELHARPQQRGSHGAAAKFRHTPRTLRAPMRSTTCFPRAKFRTAPPPPVGTPHTPPFLHPLLLFALILSIRFPMPYPSRDVLCGEARALRETRQTEWLGPSPVCLLVLGKLPGTRLTGSSLEVVCSGFGNGTLASTCARGATLIGTDQTAGTTSP